MGKKMPMRIENRSLVSVVVVPSRRPSFSLPSLEVTASLVRLVQRVLADTLCGAATQCKSQRLVYAAHNRKPWEPARSGALSTRGRRVLTAASLAASVWARVKEPGVSGS